MISFGQVLWLVLFGMFFGLALFCLLDLGCSGGMVLGGFSLSGCLLALDVSVFCLARGQYKVGHLVGGLWLGAVPRLHEYVWFALL